MNKVQGVDAIMIYADDPARTARWYADNLGIRTRLETDGNYYGGVTDAKAGKEVHVGIYPSQPERASRRRSVMVNYRVADLDAFTEGLRSRGVEVEEVVEESFGRFAYFQDPEGNPVEVWQEVSAAEPVGAPGNAPGNASGATP